MRDMNRPLTVTSDDHMGIRAALARTLTGVLWQRCQFHFQQNAQAYITTSRYKTIAAAHIRTLWMPYPGDANQNCRQVLGTVVLCGSYAVGLSLNGLVDFADGGKKSLFIGCHLGFAERRQISE